MAEFEDVLAHYGIKGMHWGVRRANPSAGGISPDADAAKRHKVTAKKSGTQALSNKELKVLVDRMNLERQYSQLNPSAASKGRKFVADTLLNFGKQEVTRIARDELTKQVRVMMSGR